MAGKRANGAEDPRRDSVLAAIRALPVARGNRAPDAVPTATDFLPGAYGIVVEAAAARKMSLSAYIRRSAYAMACHDLGVPLSDALSRDPRVSRETGLGFSDPEGTRFGVWEIERLVGEDDRPAAAD